MLTALLTGLAGTAIGAMLGMLTRRTLATLDYRLDDEQDLPLPGQQWWIIWTSALSLGCITAWIAATNSWPLAPVLLPFTLAAPALAAIDLDVMRLPNRVLAPLALATTGGLASTIFTRGHTGAAIHGVLGCVIAGGTCLLLHLASRGGVGFGDVKLAAIIGGASGSINVSTAWWALLLGAGSAMIWVRAIRRSGEFPFGPWLLGGTLVAVIASGG
jgi:leader peptidase (prepilin peptidase)/N-methyltransferase